MPEENPIDTIAMASTGGWQNWTSLYSLVSLTAGPQLLRIRTDASAFNLNWMLFEEGNTIPVIPPEDLNTQINTNEFRIFPNPLTEGNELTIEFYNEGQHQFLAELYDIYGRKLCMLHKSKTQEGRNQIITQYPDPRPVPGIYFLVIKRGKDVRQFILRIQ